MALWSLPQSEGFKDGSQGLEGNPGAEKLLLFLRLHDKASDGASQSTDVQNCALTQKNGEP